MLNLVGDWGLGIGDWGLGNPQSPIPNPQSPIKKVVQNLIIVYEIHKISF
jgi:hypothetical protein